MAGLSHFTAPTRIVAGLGALGALRDELARLGDGPIAVVGDRGVAEAGLLDRILERAGARRTVLCALVDPDPGVDDTERASVVAAEAQCEVVLTAGGGSALGLGKAVALRLTNQGPIDRYEGRDCAPHRPAASLAIPTTAGSGSEVSAALVLHDPRRNRLIVVRGHGYEPDVAILDGELLTSLPRTPMLHAALDALSHALEALWAKGASSFTDALGLSAARQLRLTLPRALHGRDPVDLQQLLEASAMANLACGSAGLGLVHALSSATAVRMPHGLQNGVLLPHVAAFNRPVLGRDGRAEVDLLAGLYDELDFEPIFGPGAITPEAGEAMIAAALDNPFRTNNRRPSTAHQLGELIAAAGVPTHRRAAIHRG